MHYVQADLELALLHLKQLEQRLARQRATVAHLRATGTPADGAEQILATLQENVQEVKIYIGRLTSNKVSVPFARGREPFVLPVRKEL